MEKPMSFLEFQRIFLRYIYSKYVLNEELSTINIRTDYIAMSFKSIVSDFFFLPKPLSKATNKQKGKVNRPFLYLSVSN